MIYKIKKGNRKGAKDISRGGRKESVIKPLCYLKYDIQDKKSKRKGAKVISRRGRKEILI